MTNKIRNLSCTKALVALSKAPVFALARMIERRYLLYLDAHRYAEAVGPLDDGRPECTFLRIYGRISASGLILTTTSSTSHARRQCPNRWKMRQRHVKCMVWHIVKLEVFAEIFEKFGSYEGHSVDERSALNIHAHWIQSPSTLFTHLDRCIFASAAC